MTKYLAKQGEIYHCCICEDGKQFPKDKCEGCNENYEDVVPASDREELPYYPHTLAGLPPNGLHPLFCEYYTRTIKHNKP